MNEDFVEIEHKINDIEVEGQTYWVKEEESTRFRGTHHGQKGVWDRYWFCPKHGRMKTSCGCRRAYYTSSFIPDAVLAREKGTSPLKRLWHYVPRICRRLNVGRVGRKGRAERKR